MGLTVGPRRQGRKGRPAGRGSSEEQTRALPIPEGRLGPLGPGAGRRGRGSWAGCAPGSALPCGPPSAFRASGPRARPKTACPVAMCGVKRFDISEGLCSPGSALTSQK